MFELSRYYEFDSGIGFDEDDMHEFKAHRSLCIDEIPSWCVEEVNNKLKRSRQSVSKTICAFLNTGIGGTVYLGVLDCGTLKGIKLTGYQRDHVLVSLHDMCFRFTPNIPVDMIKLAFVPVLSKKWVEKNASKMKKENFEFFDEDIRFHRQHSIRSSDFCWCDKEALARLNMGLIAPSYVLELTVKPWPGPDVDSSSSGIRTPLHPIYQNEEGLCYIRRQASNVQLNLQDVYEMTRNSVQNYWRPEIERLKKTLAEAEAQISSGIKSHKCQPGPAGDG